MYERTEIPERILSAGEHGSRAREALIEDANRLRDEHNLFYQLFIGGFDNNC